VAKQAVLVTWCGHVLQGDDGGWVGGCVECVVQGPGPEGTWGDCRARGVGGVMPWIVVGGGGWWGMFVGWVGCGCVSVSSGTGLPWLSRIKAVKRLCVCVCNSCFPVNCV